MITLLEVNYQDHHRELGPIPGPFYHDLIREGVESLTVYWAQDERAQFERFNMTVPAGSRFVLRRRRGIIMGSADMMDLQLIAIESPDRSSAKVFVLFFSQGTPKVHEQDGWGGPNLWSPTLHESER